MNSKNKKIYITTALPYVNSAPHIGFALEIIQADVLARYYRALGNEVFFLTGTDENGLKIAQAAERAGMAVADFAQKNAENFRALKEALNLSFDDFIRTTEQRHIKAVNKLWELCKKDIYKKEYSGLYCVGCEQFYKEEELIEGYCPEHKTKPELIEEENYFFKLSKYQVQLKELIEKDILKIIPETRKNEALGFINKGLQDICISRSSLRAKDWGIPVPSDSDQNFWCWWDAVINYISGVGYGTDDKKFKNWWQDNKNKIHIIGKGILIFHTIYWPAALLSAKIALPNKVFVHGYVTAQGQKMSKSLGNAIDPFDLVNKYGASAARYFLLREIAPTEDGDFTYEKFEARYNADLASGLGNLVARAIKLAQIFNFQFSIFPRPTADAVSGIDNQFSNSNFQTIISETQEEYHKALEEFKFNEALSAIWGLIAFCDRYIEQEQPWSLDPVRDKEKLNEVIGGLLLTLKEIAQLLEPFLPQASKNILEQIKNLKSSPIFPRIS